jgi:hypothetical protein
MDTTEVLLGMLLLLFGAGLAYYYYYYLGPRGTQRVPNVGQSQQDFGRQSEVQRDFARVFSMTSAEGKEALIKRWMDRGGCDRTEAMRLATEEWRSDNR